MNFFNGLDVLVFEFHKDESLWSPYFEGVVTVLPGLIISFTILCLLEPLPLYEIK